MEICVNHTTLFYEKAGEGKPLILLHGNGETHEIFSALIPPLAERFTVYAVDTRGHGQSAPVSEYHYEDMAADIAAFCAALGLQSPAVYGFSDGGIAALLLSLRFPHLPARIAVSGANLDPRGLKRDFLRAVKKEFAKTQAPLLRLILEEPHIPVRELKKIAVPVLVTAGERDIVRNAHTRKIAAALPHAALRCFRGETHDSYVVHSALLAPELLSFFA